MLEAGWNQYSAEYQRLRVDLEAKELEYHINRLNSITVAGSVIAGFAFTALVELDLSLDNIDKLRAAGFGTMELIYYLMIGLTVALNLYVIVLSTLTNIKGQRMALFGSVDASVVGSELPANLGYQPGMIGDAAAAAAAEEASGVYRQRTGDSALEAASYDDVQRAIIAMRSVQPSILFAFALSLCTFVIGAVAMVWIKTEPIHYLRPDHPTNHVAAALSIVFVGLLIVMAASYLWVNRLFRVHHYNDATLRARSMERSPQAQDPQSLHRYREPLVERPAAHL